MAAEDITKKEWVTFEEIAGYCYEQHMQRGDKACPFCKLDPRICNNFYLFESRITPLWWHQVTPMPKAEFSVDGYRKFQTTTGE